MSEAFDAHLAEVRGGPAPVRSPIRNSAVDEIEDLEAELVRVLLIGREAGAVILVARLAVRSRATSRGRAGEPEGKQPCSPTDHSIANSRLNTTSKLKVLPLLLVSM